jgi:ATP-dependent Zn protease
MGHVIAGLKSVHHSSVKNVIINLHSPNSPGYTVFQPSKNSIYKKEELFEHLMILLAGRISEEIVYGKHSVSSGAINDFEEARKLAEKMIVYYGMGESVIYPAFSEKYKEKIDEEINSLIESAYKNVYNMLFQSKEKILFWAKILMRKRELNKDDLDLIKT